MAFATLAVRSLDFLLAVDVRFRPQPQSLYTFFFLPLWPRRRPGHKRAARRSLARDCHHPQVL